MAPSDDPVAHFFGGRNDAPTQPVATEPDPFNLEAEADAGEGLEGEIAVDVYQTDQNVVIVSPIAGVDPSQIEITAGEDTVTISGQRNAEHLKRSENMITQEIYWGAFERTVKLPVPCEVEHASAACKQGVLTVTIPKSSKARKKTIKVKSAE